MIKPHDENNIVHISAWKNPQKQRKPNADPAKRQNNYWDLGGPCQREYDERLDSLPDEGVADTAAGEIFRAATKLYYDFHNNAMVNNTSGAINYLVKTGVLATNNENQNEHDIFGIIYPYTIGVKIHFGELEIYHAIETMMDRTLEFLRTHPKLEIMPNYADYHDLRDRDVKLCLERCEIRNRVACEMNSEAARWKKEMERRLTRTGTNKKQKDKAQDHLQLHGRNRKGIIRPSSTPESANKENDNNSTKKKKRTKKKKKNVSDCHSNTNKNKSRDVAAKFSKLGLFD